MVGRAMVWCLVLSSKPIKKQEKIKDGKQIYLIKFKTKFLSHNFFSQDSE